MLTEELSRGLHEIDGGHVPPGRAVDVARRATKRRWVRQTVFAVFGVALILIGALTLLPDRTERVEMAKSAPFDAVAMTPQDIAVFMKADADAEQIAAVRSLLEDSADVVSWTYVDKQATYDEFVEVFTNDRELIESLRSDAIPTSFRVQLADVASERGFVGRFEGQSGVRAVVVSRTNAESPTPCQRAIDAQYEEHEVQSEELGHEAPFIFQFPQVCIDQG